MPWTPERYPPAMRRLPLEVRLKAIDIANAMLDEATRKGRPSAWRSPRRRNGHGAPARMAWPNGTIRMRRRGARRSRLTAAKELAIRSGRASDSSVEAPPRAGQLRTSSVRGDTSAGGSCSSIRSCQDRGRDAKSNLKNTVPCSEWVTALPKRFAKLMTRWLSASASPTSSSVPRLRQ